jgi:hypothetical protein
MRSVVIVLAAAVLGVGTGGSLFGSSVDRERYVAANEALFAELPTYPGTGLTSTSSSEYREDESSPIVGYLTLYFFDLPPGTDPDDVAAFYERELQPEWTLVDKVTEPPYAAGPILDFRRDEASVSVNLESWRVRVLEIAVDHGGES